jgi:hypothetical protein
MSATTPSGVIEMVASDPAAWKATDFKSPADFTVSLTASDRSVLLASIETLQRTGRLVPTVALTNEDFELGALSKHLRRAYEEVRSGRGFIVLRGLPRQGLTLDEFAAIVWGIGTHFGHALSLCPPACFCGPMPT